MLMKASLRKHIEHAIDEACAELPPLMVPVASHIMQAGGKRVRGLLTVLMAQYFGCTDKKMFQLAAAVELAHAATLLHDDVLDQAETRRNKPAAYRTFGTDRVILSGDALLALASKIVAELDQPKLVRAFAEGLLWTVNGEIEEITHQGSLTPMDVYLRIIEGKTAWMIRMACELGAIYSDAPERAVQDAVAYGHNIGMAFQIVDDALDFAPNTGKPMGGDLREGKYTLPLQAYVQSLSADEQALFAQRFQDHNFSQNELEQVICAVREHGFDTKAITFAQTYIQHAHEALLRLRNQGIRPDIFSVLEEVLHAVHNRQH